MAEAPTYTPRVTDPTLDELINDPHAVNHRLRAEGPVVWVEALGGWVVTTRQAAIEVMRADEVFTVDDPRFTTGRVVGPSMLSLDGPEHTRHRTPFADGYRRSGFRDNLGAFITKRSNSLVASFAGDGTADLRGKLGAPLAVEVMTESLALDASPDDVLSTYRAIVVAVEALSAGKGEAAAVADVAMADLTDAVRRAVENGSELLAGPVDMLRPEEVVSNVAVVMFGGVETSEAMITNVLWHLLTHPDMLEAVSADRALVAGAVEESLRLEPAATRVDRYATRDVELAGTPIKERDLVIVSLAAANRDPSEFADPDVFDPRRSEARLNVTFAQGPHVCLASHVARAEAAASVEAVLDGLPNVRLAGDSVPPTGLVFRKPDRLEAEWDIT